MTLGTLLELEAPVAGAPLTGIQDAQVRANAHAAAVADVGHPNQPSLERILALQPDLIIGSSYMHGSLQEALSRIAPTLLIEPIDWRDHIRLLAGLTGRSAEADRLVGAYEERAAGIRSRMPNRTVSVVRVGPAGFQVYLEGPAAYGPYAVLQEAGVRRTPYEVTTDRTMLKRPDWEEIAALEGEILLFVVVNGHDPAADDALAAATLANPLWQMLPAVQAGRAHRVGRATWMGFSGVASAHRVLDDIERFILKTP
ncbi:ABC transporter substrate-binding protein [Xanthobacteraceae bacterium A53D]